MMQIRTHGSNKVGSRPPGDWCGTPHSNNGHVSGVPVGYRRPTARRSVDYRVLTSMI
ncbi:MAG: hypothetical protein FWE95_00315 [Planctomycetaceae bacterium]|nr:hypothetical protein [Planctomycetaceae bacterium]